MTLFCVSSLLYQRSIVPYKPSIIAEYLKFKSYRWLFQLTGNAGFPNTGFIVTLNKIMKKFIQNRTNTKQIILIMSGNADMGWRWFLSYYSLTEHRSCDWTTDYYVIDYEQLSVPQSFNITVLWYYMGADNIQVIKGHMQQM